MRALMIVLVAVVLLAGLAGCRCLPWEESNDAPYYIHDYGDQCPVCGGTGYYQGRCSRYETVWHGCQYCAQY